MAIWPGQLVRRATPSWHTAADVDGSIQASLNNDDLQARDNMVVDEWSCALTDQSLQNEKNPDQARQDFCTAQADVYTNISAGWSFWCKLTFDVIQCS